MSSDVAAAAGEAPPTASSTAQFFADFFPAAHGRLTQRWPAAWQLLQPDWMAAVCPEQQASFELGLPGSTAAVNAQLRNLSLLPIQLAGIAIGLLSARRLTGPSQAYLRFSLAYFALMNLSSIICHVLASRGTTLWHAALVADLAFTGSSSLCLIMYQVMAAPTTPAGASSASRRCWAILLTCLAVAASNLRLQLPWVPEAMYLGTTALAAAATAHRLFWMWVRCGHQQRQKQQQMPHLLLALLAVAILLACVPLDPLLCAAVGPWLGTVPLLFLGCDMGFAAIAGLAGAAAAGQGAGGSLKAD